jgi:hypothetical protein
MTSMGDPVRLRAPPASGASKLFHTIVVVGASMGCGASSTVPVPGATADASNGAASNGDASNVDASMGATDSNTSRADAGPMTYCDCTRPGTFRCEACASGGETVQGRCPGNDGVRCTCDESVAIAAASDCAHPEQFVCSLSPDADASTFAFGFGLNNEWFSFADCWCDSTRPILSSQCTSERAVLTCAIGYGCPVDVAVVSTSDAAAEAVRFACACLPPPVVIA